MGEISSSKFDVKLEEVEMWTKSALNFYIVSNDTFLIKDRNTLMSSVLSSSTTDYLCQSSSYCLVISS